MDRYDSNTCSIFFKIKVGFIEIVDVVATVGTINFVNSSRHVVQGTMFLS